MDTYCKTEKELGTAMKNGADSIYIEGDLKNKVIRIKATGKVAWGVCAASLTLAIVSYIATPEATVVTAPAGGTGGVATAVSGVVATTAASAILGSATIAAITIGVAGGGIGVLNTLRKKYEIVEKGNNYLKLRRK